MALWSAFVIGSVVVCEGIQSSSELVRFLFRYYKGLYLVRFLNCIGLSSLRTEIGKDNNICADKKYVANIITVCHHGQRFKNDTGWVVLV